LLRPCKHGGGSIGRLNTAGENPAGRFQAIRSSSSGSLLLGWIGFIFASPWKGARFIYV
jgi:hypothetical protein